MKKFGKISFEKDIETGRILQESLETSPDRKMNTLLEELDGKPRLQKSFLNVFLGENLEESVKELLKDENCKSIFGEKKAKNSSHYTHKKI